MKNNIGVTVLINRLAGNSKTVEAWHKAVGRKIAHIVVADECLRITFKDRSVLSLSDQGQSWSEKRYMVCDDSLSKFVNAKLVDATLENAPQVPSDDDDHEVQFLHIKTTKGSFTVSNHNEHNGYYGGFSIAASFQEGSPIS